MIARELGITRDAVVKHERSALAKIREILARDGLTFEDLCP